MIRVGVHMQKSIGLIVVLALAGCSVCKSSDSPEVCRTKERNHSQPRVDIAAARFIASVFAAPAFLMLDIENPG